MTLLLAIAPVVILLPVVALGGLAAWLGLRKKKAPSDTPPPPTKPKPGRAVVPKRPQTPPVVPTPLPFEYVQGVESPGAIRILSAMGTYRWATTTAVQNGARGDSNAGDVLMSLLASAPGMPLQPSLDTGVVITQMPPPNDDEWGDLFAAASTMTWDELVTASERWLQDKGLA